MTYLPSERVHAPPFATEDSEPWQHVRNDLPRSLRAEPGGTGQRSEFSAKSAV